MKRVSAFVFASILAGCATWPAAPPSPPAANVVVAGAADELLASLSRLMAMSAPALAAEEARLRQAALEAPSDLARLKAAMALALSPAYDEAEIVRRVTPVLREATPAEPSLRAMASFLLVMAVEQGKLRESLATVNAELRDGQREALTQRRRADAEHKRAEGLQQKLNALTDLEKSLADRKRANDYNRRPR